MSMRKTRARQVASTRPHKKAVRTKSARPVWYSEVCEENNSLLRIGNEAYVLSADGYLMPSKKDQAPPDLRSFQAK
jgi:hypothetical protein